MYCINHEERKKIQASVVSIFAYGPSFEFYAPKFPTGIRITYRHDISTVQSLKHAVPIRVTNSRLVLQQPQLKQVN